MPGFVQIMEFDTSNIEGIDDLGRQLQAELGDKFLARRATTTEDRERRGHYYVIVEFDSYEEAMANSENPLTSKYAEEAGKLLESPLTFHDLDVVTVMDWR
jgi:uncharacterized protein (DUF1330 family)